VQTLESTASVGRERRAIRILHLEDVRLDAELIQTILTSSGVRCEISVTPRRADFEAAVKDQPFDIILCDHGLPDYDGFSALRFAQENQPTTPVIVLSGVLDESHAVESLKSGATDYILKQRLTRLVAAVERALREARERAEKRQLELAFLRAQRMDSLGSLAGGIAHDLNNALAPIQMSVEVLKSTSDESIRQRYLDVISASTQRATGMVRQILRFARGHGRIGPVSVAGVVREMSKIIQDTFPKSISIFVDVGGQEVWQIQGDATEIHQVLLNLCVNARDAMSGGGILMISAKNIILGESDAARLRTVAGRYVMLSVGDTGVGIAPEVLPRIFEPFFTTKMPEQGTGLGLSTVAGIVKSHGGCVDVKTAPSQGTEFRVYLPASEGAADEESGPSSGAELPVGNGELVLVVEDEEAVRELIKTTLENYGYRVVTAKNGVQGLTRFEEQQHEIRVLVTDTDMPFMDGLQVIHAIKTLKPDLPVIIASGSKRDDAELSRLGPGEMTSLGKPFSAEQLILAVGFAVQNAIED
jgi:two-component system, cell cycle sensor histidine kinase and response regulator CckA